MHKPERTVGWADKGSPTTLHRQTNFLVRCGAYMGDAEG